MLCDKYRMPFHRRLFSIILGERRRQSGRDEINGVGSDGVDALVPDVLVFFIRQFESGSELLIFEVGEGIPLKVVLSAK